MPGEKRFYVERTFSGPALRTVDSDTILGWAVPGRAI